MQDILDLLANESLFELKFIADGPLLLLVLVHAYP